MKNQAVIWTIKAGIRLIRNVAKSSLLSCLYKNCLLFAPLCAVAACLLSLPCSAKGINSQKIECFSEIRYSRPIIVVILGHPGAGKGTFAQTFKEKGWIHLSIGDFLRNEFRHQTDIGLRWKAEIQASGILAIEVIKEVTSDLIQKIAALPPQIYILDGHVRLLEQAKYLDELLNVNTNIYPLFVYINTDKDEAFRRILHRRTCEKCNYIYNLVTSPTKKEGFCDYCEGALTHRETDNELQAKNRIDTYASHLQETIKYYRDRNVLIEFNGNLPIQECIAEYRKFFECTR